MTAGAGGDRLLPALRDATIRWVADDPSPADRAELQRVLADAMAGRPGAVADLTSRMSAPLAFGTAGLRGPLRAGPAGMNLAVVRRAAAGIAAYLTAGGSRGGTVIVGHDARNRSREFALDAAGVLAAAGFRVLLAPSASATPLTAYAVRALDAVAGVQITASHNPPQDNGLKVYLAGGAQLIGPADAEIERAIAAARPAVSIDASGRPAPWPEEIVEGYVRRAGELAVGAGVGAGLSAGAGLRIALTPMHGVGGELAVRALREAGFTGVHVVAEQAVPDGAFPTVTFPNPEEPGASDLLLALASRVDADLAVALDPDADRCALGVAWPAGDGAASWRMLTGDEAGVLLGDHVLATLDRAAHPDPLVATTVVSSDMLRAIAARHGARYDRTLTGFKWIVRAGDGQGTGLVFGYEEALGLCVDPDVVRDKDGITAAVVAAALAARLKVSGGSLPGRLDELAREHGLYVTDQLAVRVDDLRLIDDAMARLRGNSPDALGGEPLVDVNDLLPRTDALLWRTARARVVVRPSGTEPKLKCYLEIVTPVDDGADLLVLRERVAGEMRALLEEVRTLVGL